MSSISNTTRISGLVSGMDIDSMVAKLMDAERLPLDKLYREKQLTECRQDAYREISNALRAFNDKYFDILNRDSYMLTQSAYNSFSTTISDPLSVKVTPGSGVKSGSHSIKVSNLATAAKYKSTAAVSKDIIAAAEPDFAAAAGKEIVLELDGEKYSLELGTEMSSIEDLQSAVDKAVGEGKVEITLDDSGYIVVSAAADSGVGKITISGEADSALPSLGFTDGANLSNRISISDTLETLSGKMEVPLSFTSDGKLIFSINGTNFEFDKTDTLTDMMDEINSSSAGVTMEYSQISDTLTLTAKKTGAGNRINLSEAESSFFESTGVTNYTAGEDAEVYLDGEKLVRSGNTITAGGVTYELLSETTTNVSVSISLDTDDIYEKIETFVNDYNALIDTINDKLTEEYDRDYPPLTSEEKEAMSEDEIELWESKAKTGLLHNDSILKKLTDDMRSALYVSIEGMSKSLYNIGITTSSSYSDKGKLIINQEVLKEAIKNNPSEVVNIFSKQSETHSGTVSVRSLNSAERAVRTREEGIAHRLFDIMQDCISTYRDSSGRKGTLIEKAGLEDDPTEFSNLMYDEVLDYEEQIEKFLDRLAEKEEQYYARFTEMETYISNMNAQLSSLQSILA
ncbi:MAG TPA: flagellar filament capping protein FliD [Clostridia bacterium]|nr:flagellar filament capping protein FliD [Clostridia bacterium]